MYCYYVKTLVLYFFRSKNEFLDFKSVAHLNFRIRHFNYHSFTTTEKKPIWLILISISMELMQGSRKNYYSTLFFYESQFFCFELKPTQSVSLSYAVIFLVPSACFSNWMQAAAQYSICYYYYYFIITIILMGLTQNSSTIQSKIASGALYINMVYTLHTHTHILIHMRWHR